MPNDSAARTQPQDDSQPRWLRILTSTSTAVGAISAMVAAAGVFIVALAVATGNFSSIAKLFQGFNVTENATIDAPIFLGRQSFADFKASWQSKTFENGQVEHDYGDHRNETLQGDVLAWIFHIHGYASASYSVFYEDSGVLGYSRDVLCEFRAETTDDSAVVCEYFAPTLAVKPQRSRRITVWLRGEHAPIAVRTYIFDDTKDSK